MYKLLIVDDEPIERLALRKLIKQHFTTIEIVGEAANGMQAVEMAERNRPDIITMDIKMPELDGVEAIKAIRSMNLFPKFIVVSAFDTFDYAREVMKEGVKEYLLKPADTEEVVETLTRTMSELYTDKQQHRKETELASKLKQSINLIKMEWVTSLFLDTVQSFELEDWQKDVIPFTEGFAAIIRFQGKESDIKEGYRFLKTWVEEHLKGMAGPVTGQHMPLLLPKSSSIERSRETLYQKLLELTQLHALNSGPFTLQIGLGKSARNAGDYTHSFRQAALALEKTNLQHAVKLYEPSMEKNDENNNDPLFSIEEKLISAIKNKDKDNGLSILELYLHKLKQLTHHDVKAIRRYLNDFFHLIHTVMTELGIKQEQVYLLPPGCSLIQLEELTRKEINDLADEINNWQNSGTQGMIEEAKEYIRRNFTKALSLEEMAERTGMSPYYFSKQFKAQTGVTFIDYVTSARIAESKNSLQYTRLSLKEIAYQIGYNDPNYYSRVFKKIEGVSPKEFRKQHLARSL